MTNSGTPPASTLSVTMQCTKPSFLTPWEANVPVLTSEAGFRDKRLATLRSEVQFTNSSSPPLLLAEAMAPQVATFKPVATMVSLSAKKHPSIWTMLLCPLTRTAVWGLSSLDATVSGSKKNCTDTWCAFKSICALV